MNNQTDDIIDFSGLVTKLVYPFKLIKKYTKLLLVYLFIALSLAIALKFTLPSQYSGSFIIKPNETTDMYFINMLLDIKTLVDDKDYEGLKNELKLEDADVSLLKKITIKPISSGKGADSIKSVIITLNITQPNKLLPIQTAIINYLDNNQHYQKVKNIRLSNIDSLEKKIIREIREMDSVKKLIVANIKTPASMGSGLVYNVPIDPYKAYDINMQRYKEELSLISQKKDTESFELIKPCVASNKPVWPKLLILLGFTMCLFILTFLIHAHVKEQKVQPVS